MLKKYLAILLLFLLVYSQSFSQSYSITEEEIQILEQTLTEQKMLIEDLTAELKQASLAMQEQQKYSRKLELGNLILKITIPAAVITTAIITYRIVR